MKKVKSHYVQLKNSKDLESKTDGEIRPWLIDICSSRNSEGSQKQLIDKKSIIHHELDC